MSGSEGRPIPFGKTAAKEVKKACWIIGNTERGGALADEDIGTGLPYPLSRQEILYRGIFQSVAEPGRVRIKPIQIPHPFKPGYGGSARD